MVEERVQRRLAAILAADVVGYSRLIGQDEEGTLRALKAVQDEVIAPQIAETPGTHLQAGRRRSSRRIREYCRSDALRHGSTGGNGGAQFGSGRGPAHSLPHRH